MQLTHRPRRLRRTPWIRDLVRESTLHAEDLIWPVFVIDGTNTRQSVASMPGVERLTIDLLTEKAREAQDCGMCALAESIPASFRARSVDGPIPGKPIGITVGSNCECAFASTIVHNVPMEPTVLQSLKLSEGPVQPLSGATSWGGCTAAH